MAYLNKCFHIKDLGVLKYFVGIEVAKGLIGLLLGQQKYALEMTDRCGPLGSKPINLPINTNHELALALGNTMDELTQY